jgi:UDP-glucose 4-epimerase
LINLLTKNGIKKLFFSSTAAVYGAAGEADLISEDAEKHPVSPYGISKLAAENCVTEFLSKPGNTGTSLRFFNVVGAAAPELADNSKDNLIPILIDRLKSGAPPTIFGTDYPTSDGTCVRDYVDVRDVARAHVAVINHSGDLPPAMNVGTGSGISVREIINILALEFGVKDPIVIESMRRTGDPSQLCADVSLIADKIGFQSRFGIRESMQSLLGS